MGTVTSIYNVRVHNGKSSFGIAPGGYQVGLTEAERIIEQLMTDPTSVTIALFLYGEVVENEHGKWFFLNQFLPTTPKRYYHRPIGKSVWCAEE